MDVYSLTRKKRPSHLTLAQPSSSSRTLSDNDSALDVSLSTKTISKSTNSRSPSSYIFDEVTGSPTRDHWKVKAGDSFLSLKRKFLLILKSSFFL